MIWKQRHSQWNSVPIVPINENIKNKGEKNVDKPHRYAMPCRWNYNKIFVEYFHFTHKRTNCATFHRISLKINAFHLNLIADWEFFTWINRINGTENGCDNNFDRYLDYWKHMRLHWPKIQKQQHQKRQTNQQRTVFNCNCTICNLEKSIEKEP